MTIAQQLNIKDFPFEIKDKNGQTIYHETSSGWWFKRQYDANGNKILHENSGGYWSRRKYDAQGYEIYFENSDQYWAKHEYDTNGNQIYYETSSGFIIDNRPKPVELSMDEIAQKFGVDVSLIKIMK